MTLNPPSRENFDVIIVGVGAMGSAALDALANRGAKVLGIEQFSIAHDRGSSHGGSRIIRQSYFEHPDYVPWLKRAYELWEQLDSWWEEPIMHITGGLYMGPSASPTFAGSLLAAELHHLPHKVLSSSDVHQRFPQFHPGHDDTALFEEIAGWVVPEETIRAQVARAQLRGAELKTGIEVQNITCHPHEVQVHCSDGATYRADQIILSPGAWASHFLADLNFPMKVERQVMYWFDPTDLQEHFESSPVYVHESPAGEQIYGFPANSEGAKVAFFRKGTLTQPDTLIRDVCATEIQAMRQRLAETIPTLSEGKLRQAKACMYTTTADENFIIGRHPTQHRILLACGFSGHGFKFVPVVGEVLADMISSNSDDCGVTLFDPRRFSEVQAATDH
ncbi:N-methyl-L-tryptophan oxidase [Corynebacterium poyangense]|uniref:N-methyl-L-tryptophan oxidase n=1 Tax=Corynebacterium poyangense TaxID=2684405 RepID=A0A7H0SLY5_9CORY|nr:N-methyl-L-tryptophan oxidase [Corynebacterium poyangense]QNQ89560.1 N-methyl-L-tryptophan oxidase [Corynebacterium poyangense]